MVIRTNKMLMSLFYNVCLETSHNTQNKGYMSARLGTHSHFTVLVRAKYVRWSWALQAERSVHYSPSYLFPRSSCPRFWNFTRGFKTNWGPPSPPFFFLNWKKEKSSELPENFDRKIFPKFVLKIPITTKPQPTSLIVMFEFIICRP